MRYGIFLLLPLLVLPTSASGEMGLLKKHFLKGHQLLKEGRSDQALPHFLKIRDLNVAMRDYILYDLGRTLAAQDRCDEAREVFEELLEKYPESRWQTQTRRRLQSKGCPLPPPGHLPEETPPCDGIVRDDRKAECLFRSRHYSQAKLLYQKLAPLPKVAKERSFYLVRLSQSAARSQDYQTAIEANETLRARYPKSREAHEATRKIAFLELESGNYRQAIPLFEQILTSSSHASPHEQRELYEKIGWCHYRLREFEEAIENFDLALAESETPFGLYWKGRSLVALGRKRDAMEIFGNLLIVYPESYYGLRAAEKIGRPAKSELRKWWPRMPGGLRWIKRSELISTSSYLERIYELQWLKLDPDVRVESRRARSAGVIPPFNDPWQVREVGEVGKIRKKKGQFSLVIRAPYVEHAGYVLPHAAVLFGEARKGGIDPFLLYGMMRQESRYREKVVSPAGAIGLLQIMPGTGRKLAMELEWSDYESQWLYDPITNIELSTRYLKKLSHLFDKKWYAVAASYNAGERVVQAWLKQRKGISEEEFIEEIPYAETRDYVKRVFLYWRAYRSIYQ